MLKGQVRVGKNGKIPKHQWVDYVCDKCGNDFKSRPFIQDKNEHNICKSCLAKINGKNQNRNVGRKQANPTHKQFWLDKGMTLEQATQEIAKRKRDNPAFWLAQGCSINEAEEKAASYAKTKNPLCVEYWLTRGHTLESAKDMLLKTKDKTFERRKGRDCSATSRFSQKYWLSRGYSKDDAQLHALEEQQKIHRNRKFNTKSCIEEKALNELAEYLEMEIEHDFLVISGDHSFIADCRIGHFLIEFNGTAIHLDRRFYSENMKSFTKQNAVDVWQRDNEKREVYLKEGYNLLVVWEHDYQTNKFGVFSRIKEIIKNEDGKTGIYWDSSSLEH